VMECFDISNISTTHVVASMVSFRDGVPDKNNYRRYRIRTVEGQDDFASMAEVVRRRYSRVLLQAREANPDAAEFSQEDPIEAMARVASGATVQVAHSPASQVENLRHVRLPDLIIVDGGKGQLSSACRELQRLGLHELPIIGLAKEFEEIYRPGVSEPLRLPHESGALKLLQRVRDESHRFANTYNARLRLKKISESILDEFPGIGEQRKAALLKKFGSVQRLRLATVEQIAAVHGFGGKAAAELKAFLDARTARPESSGPV